MALGILSRLLPFGVFRQRPPEVAVLRLHGIIGRVGALGGRGLDLQNLEGLIERAFRRRGVAAVCLAVNSPGGSPVQSAQICGRIRALADERGVPVFAFAEDVTASGGYWLALAGDEIYADASSIVGSIGVVFRGFGLSEAIRRLGIERRVHTAGARKGALDPFRPEDPEDVKLLESVQKDIHDAFIEAVRTRRGDRLKGPEDELFSGAFWSGRQALALGLIDGIGDLRSVMRARFGDKVRFRAVAPRRSWLRRRFSIGAADPVSLGEALVAAVEERLIWSRFGL